MKRSLKALLAIAASSSTTLALATSSGAAVVGFEDERLFTGVYSQQLEATRSCTINVRNQGGGMPTNIRGGLDQSGTVIQLARRAGSANATGSVVVEFDASGANGVYFAEDTFEVARYDRDENDWVPDGSGKITLQADSKSKLNIRGGVEEEAIDELRSEERGLEQANVFNGGRELAMIKGESQDVDINEAGIITGKFRNGTTPQSSRSLSQLSAASDRPSTTKAILNMSIDDVNDYDGAMLIQARLVCAPLGLDNEEGGGLRPILDN